MCMYVIYNSLGICHALSHFYFQNTLEFLQNKNLKIVLSSLNVSDNDIILDETLDSILGPIIFY